MWTVPRMWEGGEVWILGGGPSVPKQFNIPDSVIQNVLSKSSPPSVYSPYMEAIHDKHIIGINCSFMIGDWIDMVFFGDRGFFLMYQKQLAEFPGLRVCCNPLTTTVDWVKYIPMQKSKVRGISFFPNSVCWNYNSGAAAISIAANAGAKRIILLGFDMKLSDDKAKHWHNVYGTVGNLDEKKQNNIFNKHLIGFPFIAKDAKQLGIEIINASPDSAINDFPKMNVKDLL